MMRQGRQGNRSTQASIRRKNSVSLFFTGGAGSDDLRNSGDHWQELLVDPDIPGEILCRFPVVFSLPPTDNVAGLADWLFVICTDDFLICFSRWQIGRKIHHWNCWSMAFT
jgi:hypothetical protein